MCPASITESLERLQGDAVLVVDSQSGAKIVLPPACFAICTASCSEPSYADLQGDSLSRVFDDPKGLFASAPVNTALTKSKSRDSSEKLTVPVTASVTAGYEAIVAELLSPMHLLYLVNVLSVSQRAKKSQMLTGWAVVACICAAIRPQSPHAVPQQRPRGPENDVLHRRASQWIKHYLPARIM